MHLTVNVFYNFHKHYIRKCNTLLREKEYSNYILAMYVYFFELLTSLTATRPSDSNLKIQKTLSH